MPGAVTMTMHTRTVLRAFLAEDPEPVYGRQLVALTGFPTGTVHPLLARLLAAGLVDRSWEDDAAAEAEGRPRRRLYRLTDAGADLARTIDTKETT